MKLISLVRNAILLLPIVLLAFFHADASHLSGGQMTYQYLGDSSGYHKYQVTLSIYEDYKYGSPEAIAQDNPAIFAIYDGLGQPIYFDTAIYYSSLIELPDSVINFCGRTVNGLYLQKKTFVMTCSLPTNSTGYYVCYERGERDGLITNVTNPSNEGVAYFCTIPGETVTNNSAVFNYDFPKVVCLNNNLHIDMSATDADGDSLTYAFTNVLSFGTNNLNIKPIAPPPPYAAVPYLFPYNYAYPVASSPALQINPTTGTISGTPNTIGRYLVSLYCYEWRSGSIIDSVRRDFDLLVASCGPDSLSVSAGDDTTIFAGDTLHFNASGATHYSWTPGTLLSCDTIANPVALFMVPGLYIYYVNGSNDSGCAGTDSISVSVLATGRKADFYIPTIFAPQGNNLHIENRLDPIPVEKCLEKSFKVYNQNGDLLYNGNGGWDGTYKGLVQKMGIYFWVLTYEDKNGKTNIERGKATLVY